MIPPSHAAPAAELRAAVDRLVARLRLVVPDGATLVEPVEPHPPPPAGSLHEVVGAFGLDAAARDVLVLAAAVELDARAARLVERATRGRGVTVGLALAAVEDARWDVVVPTAPLRAHRLVDVGPGPLTAATLTIDERVLHALLGATTLDARLATRVRPTEDPGAPPAGYAAAISTARAALSLPVGGGDGHHPAVATALARARRGVTSANGKLTGVDRDRSSEGPSTGAARGVQVIGGPATDRPAVAAAALHGSATAWTVLSTELPSAVDEQDAFARLWNREVVLGGAALVVEVAAASTPADEHAVARLVRRLDGAVVVCADAPVAGGPDASVALPRLPADDQRMLWRRHLGTGAAERAAADVTVDRFDLGWQPILRAAALVSATTTAHGEASRLALPGSLGRDVEATDDEHDHASGTPPDATSAATGEELARRCAAAVHAVVRPALEGLAQHVATAATRDRLALPPAVEAVLDDVVRHVRRRRRVHDDWGFDGSRGRGVTAVFAGPSGTGKTLAAEVLATELDLELWRVDLSSVVSKYIGETEKQLRRLLDAAEAGTVLLLFDEADALFGSRTEVRDSHDRYANQEVAYLLQRLETFRGVAVLTTNMRAAMDEAFLRRFRFVATFPFPDAGLRERIWDAVVPAVAPFARVDVERLAKLELTGGHLRNVALAAAVRGADEGGVVTGEHLRHAVRQEYAKLGRTLTSSEEAALVAATGGNGARP